MEEVGQMLCTAAIKSYLLVLEEIKWVPRTTAAAVHAGVRRDEPRNLGPLCWIGPQFLRFVLASSLYLEGESKATVPSHLRFSIPNELNELYSICAWLCCKDQYFTQPKLKEIEDNGGREKKRVRKRKTGSGRGSERGGWALGNLREMERRSERDFWFEISLMNYTRFVPYCVARLVLCSTETRRNRGCRWREWVSERKKSRKCQREWNERAGRALENLRYRSEREEVKVGERK